MQKRFTPAPKNNELAAQQSQQQNPLISGLTSLIPQIQRALPKNLSADRMARVVLTEFRKTPQLMQCEQSSLFAAILECAQLGLEPGGTLQQAFLIPRRRKDGSLECQLQPGYQGYIELAERDGRVTLIGRAVYANEIFDVEYGTDEKIIHKPCITEEPGKIIGAYAVAKYKDGRTKFLFLNIAKIEEAKKRSQSGDKGPWKTDYDAMAIKTAIRRLFKFLPKSPELARALEIDEAIEMEQSQNLGQPEIKLEDFVDSIPEHIEQEPIDPMESEPK